MSAPAEAAVDRFESSDQELQEFMQDNDDLIIELRRLVEERNSALKEAAIAVKSQLKNSNKDRLVVGRFGAIKKRREWWDGQKLAALIPAKNSYHFLEEKIMYEVNVTKLEQMIRQGEVDREDAYKAFTSEAPTLSLMPGAPKEMKI